MRFCHRGDYGLCFTVVLGQSYFVGFFRVQQIYIEASMGQPVGCIGIIVNGVPACYVTLR
jgi:hypothetical protein